MSTNRNLIVAGTLVVPVLFLIRNLGRWSEISEQSAENDRLVSNHLEQLDVTQREGSAFGAHTDEEGCVAEVLQRTVKDVTFSQSSHGASFLRGCLEASAKAAGYCDKVPPYEGSSTPPAEAQKSNQWRKAQCETIGSTEWSCAAQLKFVQLHCHPLVGK